MSAGGGGRRRGWGAAATQSAACIRASRPSLTECLEFFPLLGTLALGEERALQFEAVANGSFHFFEHCAGDLAGGRTDKAAGVERA